MKRTTSLSRRLNAVADEVESSNMPRKRFEADVAITPQDRIEAARLVTRAYVHEGYLSQDSSDPYLSIHHLLKETTIFIVRHGGRIIGTLAVILDSHAGLPMEDLYGNEIEKLRQAGRRVCELCSLAIDLESGSQHFGLVLDLFRAAGTYAFCMAQVHDLCLTIKPTHARFYSRLACQELGSLKLDERFAFAETLAMRLSREIIKSSSNSNQRCELQSRPMARAITALSMEEQIRLRGQLNAGAFAAGELLLTLANLPDILARATPHQIAYLLQTQSRIPKTYDLSNSVVHGDVSNRVVTTC